jgi:hypothetical protein
MNAAQASYYVHSGQKVGRKGALLKMGGYWKRGYVDIHRMKIAPTPLSYYVILGKSMTYLMTAPYLGDTHTL